MRITSLAEPGKEALLELALECGHSVRRFDPGQQMSHLRPHNADCYKCDRSLPTRGGLPV